MQTLSMGRVTLTVNDIKKVGGWYENTVGLIPMGQDGETARYGTGQEVLLELRQDHHARLRSPREAGLFHTAFLLPQRSDLARWILNASEKRFGIDGASDHLVSEALYLTDPEGNGVEIYTDRPRSAWNTNGVQVEMSSDPLDIHDLVAAAHGPARWQGFPLGTTIGHMHLQVGTLPEAEAFYHQLLGLDITTHYPGAVFMAADGYHHHIAANIWQSRGAGVRNMPSTGLTDMEIRLSPDRAAEIVTRLETAGKEPSLGLTDPWGTPITLTIV